LDNSVHSCENTIKNYIDKCLEGTNDEFVSLEGNAYIGSIESLFTDTTQVEN